MLQCTLLCHNTRGACSTSTPRSVGVLQAYRELHSAQQSLAPGRIGR